MNALQKRDSFSFLPMFSEMFENDFFSNKFANNLPAVNVKENDTEFNVEVAAPGLKKNDFKITTENGMINISAEHEDRKEEKDENYTRKEYNYNSFSRSFILPDNVIDENVKAKYEDGVLKLSLPKKAEPKINSKKKQVMVL
jgi:HSP20 family protein